MLHLKSITINGICYFASKSLAVVPFVFILENPLTIYKEVIYSGPIRVNIWRHYEFYPPNIIREFDFYLIPYVKEEIFLSIPEEEVRFFITEDGPRYYLAERFDNIIINIETKRLRIETTP